MAQIRANDWGTEEYWADRISQYLTGEMDTQESLHASACFVAMQGERVVGPIAGHLTRRFGCEGELQWISIRPEFRGIGIASRLLCLLAEWFLSHNARRICVDVEPSNEAARRFYARHGAQDLKPHWMTWDNIQTTLDPPKK